MKHSSPLRLRRFLPTLRANVLCFATTALLCGCHSEPPPPPPAASKPSLFEVPESQLGQLEILTVKKKAVSVPLELPAKVTFDALTTSQVVPLVSGKVARLFVHEGDHVKSGQALLAIASPDSADVQANLERDQAALRNSQSVLARDQDLYAHHAISLEALQQAQLDVASQKASLQSDQAHARITGTGPHDAVLRSPIAGVVVSRHVSVGDSVQAGSTVAFTVTDPSEVWVVGQLYPEDLQRVAVGDPVRIQSPTVEKPLGGKVTYIGAAIDPETLTIPVRIAVKTPEGLLKSGLYVDASIFPAKPKPEIEVPATAVLRDEDNLPYVYVQAAVGQFARRSVKLGAQVGKSYVIRSGLKVGEKIIGGGALFVSFAQSLE